MIKLEIVPYEADAGFGLLFPAKTFILKTDRHLVVISPSIQAISKLESLRGGGQNMVFIAPNNFHNTYLSKMFELYPEADFYGPERSAKKSKVALEAVNNFYDPDIIQTPILGSETIGETVFYIPAQKKLIVTDWVVNMHHKMSFSMKMAMKTAGCYHKPGISRTLKLTIKDKAVFRESMRSLLAFDFDEVFVNHGDSLNRAVFEEIVLKG